MNASTLFALIGFLPSSYFLFLTPVFVDEAIVTFYAGRGGHGCISWRREANIPKGGPWGGDGGKGGDVILRANENINTLSEFRYKKELRAQNGEGGSKKDMHGANGEDLIVFVPVGTLVKDPENGDVLYDLSEKHDEVKLCRGGRGGFGNAHFTSPTRQKPNFAELGDRGETKKVQLELKLVADVGIIGLPSVGKSTFISSMTNVRPKIAEYHFTTLVPNLGVMEYKGYSLVLEDVPGLIKGASEGEGLGHQFLRHIQRTNMLLHLIDATRYEECIDDYTVIRNELEKFDPAFKNKQEFIALTKCDLLDEDMVEDVKNILKEHLPEAEIFAISAPIHDGTEALQNRLIQHFDSLPKKEVSSEGYTHIDLRTYVDPNAYAVHDIAEGEEYRYEIRGERIQQIVRMTDMENVEAVQRVYDVFRKIGADEKVAAQMLKRWNEQHPDDQIDFASVYVVIPDVIVEVEGQEFRMGKVIYQ